MRLNCQRAFVNLIWRISSSNPSLDTRRRDLRAHHFITRFLWRQVGRLSRTMYKGQVLASDLLDDLLRIFPTHRASLLFICLTHSQSELLSVGSPGLAVAGCVLGS